MKTENLTNLFPNLRENVLLKDWTTFGVGGTAKYFLEVNNKLDLMEVVKKSIEHNISYLVFAGGSNMVFSDNPPDILYICYRTIENENTYKIENNKVLVEAGLPLSFLIDLAIDNNLAGLESLSGIPGSVGGAVVGNAGAYGQSISDHLEQVEIFDGEKVREITREECGFKYRHSLLKDEKWLVLSATFNLKTGDKEELKEISQKIISIRNEKYKPSMKCPGSFFKNVLIKDVEEESLKLIPEKKIIEGKIPAGFLLESIGAKGMREGDVEVADFHGNLILNTNDGTFCDVKKLSQTLKNKVKERFNIDLEEEVRLVE